MVESRMTVGASGSKRATIAGAVIYMNILWWNMGALTRAILYMRPWFQVTSFECASRDLCEGPLGAESIPRCDWHSGNILFIFALKPTEFQLETVLSLMHWMSSRAQLWAGTIRAISTNAPLGKGCAVLVTSRRSRTSFLQSAHMAG